MQKLSQKELEYKQLFLEILNRGFLDSRKQQIVKIFRTYDYQTQVLAASIRSPLHIIKCAEVGADVVTSPLASILGLLKHPLTDAGLEKFLADYNKGNK